VNAAVSNQEWTLSMNPITFTNACILIAISYVALRLKNRLFMERFELWSAPVLTGLACLIMMLQPSSDDMFTAILCCAPIIMAGLRFGWIVSLLSTLLPVLYLYGFVQPVNYMGIVQDLLISAIAASLFHRKESASGFSRIPLKDGLKACTVIGLIRMVSNGFIEGHTSNYFFYNHLLVLLLLMLIILILIAMYNEDNRTWILQRQLELQANQDGLTGLPNLRSFMNIARNTVKLRPLTIMMVDIDNFKRYNDTFGHLQGDRLLREVGQILRYTVNEHDYVARYGGEEFIILSHLTDVDLLSDYAETLCKAVASHQSNSLEEASTTISIGVSVSHNEHSDLLRIISEADEALYDSKRNGKNRHTFHHQSIPVTIAKNA
jgi:diguanylate cyclase